MVSADTNTHVGLRERKRQRTRERIIRVGIELFAERGFKTTTISDIAAAADISPRTFFLYFDRKDHLLFEEQRRAARAIASALKARRDGELTIDVLERLMRELARAPSQETLRLRRLRYAVIASDPQLQGPDHSEFADALREPLKESYAVDLRAARAAQPENASRLLTGLTIGATMELVYMNRESVIRDTRDQDVDQLMALANAIFRSASQRVRRRDSSCVVLRDRLGASRSSA